MVNEMIEYQFKDLMLGFYDGPHATPSLSDEGPIFLGIKNILETGGIDFKCIRHISEAEYPKWTKRVVPQKDDIVFSYEATLHRYALIPDGFRGCLGRRMALIRVNKEIVNEKFLYQYFLSSKWKAFIETVKISGATVERISISKFPNYKITLPSLSIQKKIASILYSYDELIENNKQRIKLLEEMAEEIYKEWFVRLRFPGYENAKIVDGLPEGWEKDIISNYYVTSSGGTPSRAKEDFFKDGTINWLKTKELLDTFTFSAEEKITEIALKESSAKIFPRDTILIGMYGGVHGEGRKSTLGQLGILGEESSTNQASCAFIPKNIYYSYPYLFLFLKSKRADFLNKSMGAAQQNISQDIIKNSPYIQPEENIIKCFDSLIKPFFEEIKILTQKNQLLQEIRDLLLPRLMSGKLSVEHLVEEELGMVAEERAAYNKV